MLVGVGSLGTKFSADRNIRLADVAFLHKDIDLSLTQSLIQSLIHCLHAL